MAKEYQTFKDFYPFYLSQHQNKVCRVLHYVGSLIAIGLLISAFYLGNYWLILGALVSGYAFAWVGHFFFEKNRPATFTYPWYSFIGDWQMLKDALFGKPK
ncbi:Mpo1-like protein [Thalassotalea euphylliae]|uniref:Mpo1-like protein n=1 Tax=Thalassotalea euphylliae TaxID=1655234 RepID=UPI0036330D56